MSEKIFTINEINICTESFGNPTNPVVLMIMGAMCSMVYWDDDFCQQLANKGHFRFVRLPKKSTELTIY
jgi:pimeloyl-ACP methyl ester carboxylesterase